MVLFTENTVNNYFEIKERYQEMTEKINYSKDMYNYARQSFLYADEIYAIDYLERAIEQIKDVDLKTILSDIEQLLEACKKEYRQD